MVDRQPQTDDSVQDLAIMFTFYTGHSRVSVMPESTKRLSAGQAASSIRVNLARSEPAGFRDT
ncbi:MAG: hypothetical protein EA377_11650, partial [Phycisphaerales bacterium]